MLSNYTPSKFLSPPGRVVGLSLFLAVLVLSSPVAGQPRTRSEVFRFDRGKLAFGQWGSYDLVRYPGLDLSCDVGTPQLPVKLVHIPVPAGMEISGIRIVRLESETIEGEYDLFPVQTPQPLSQPLAPFVNGTAEVYSSSRPFPADVVSLGAQGFAAGFNVGAFVVYPLRYLPAEKRLVFHSLIEVEVSYVPSARRSLRFRPSVYSEAIHRRALEKLVEQPEGLSRSFDGAPSLASSLPDEEHPYVIITDTMLTLDFQLLADWKTLKGLSAEIVTTSWIQSMYPGVDLQERIRNFIEDAYQNWGTVWVLLGGDTNIIPARATYAMTSGYGAGPDAIPCDLYYADLDGDWNANGNSTYGEVADDVDMYPEVFVGRAPVENGTEASDWARKVQIYESWYMRPPGVDHGLDMLFLAEILWANPYTNSGEGKDHIDEMYVPARFDPITKLYEALGNENYTTVMDALNAGQNIVNHDGHAWYTSMGIGTSSLMKTDMDALTNEYRPSVLYSIGCWPAAFDYDCIAEHFLTNRVGGGVAFIGNSRYGWGSPGNPLFGYSDRFDQQFFKQLFVEDVCHAGQTLSAAKSVYVPFAQQENVYRWCEYEINLLGDPEMPIWTDAAQPMEVTRPVWVPVGTVRCPVVVRRASDGVPIEDALVCLMKEGEVYETGLTGPDGRVEFEIAPATPTDDLFLTVTAHNMNAFNTTIAVNSASPYVQISSYATDVSEEGFVTPGATVSMDACFKNYGDQTADGLTATLHGAGWSVTMIDSTESIGTLAPGDSLVVTGAFEFTTAGELENGEVFHLESRVSDDGERVWDRKLAVTCATPVLRYDRHVALDDASGDGDGFVDAGETVSLNVHLVNDGLDSAVGATATLATESPYLSFGSTVLSLGDLHPGDRAGGHTEVTIDPSCPEPLFAVVHLQINASGGWESSDSLVLAVGEFGLSDDMENGEGGWTHAGAPDAWHLSTHRARSGSASWYCGVEGVFEYGANMDDTLLAPPLTIGEDTELSFWCWYECATYGVDGVYVDVNGGLGWTTLDFLGSGGALGALTVGNDWLEYKYDLSGYPGGTELQLRFRFVSDGDAEVGEGVYIDDVRVGSEGPGIVVAIGPRPESALGDVLFQNYPNPFNPTTTIEYSIAQPGHVSLEIFNAAGQRVRMVVDEEQAPRPGGFAVTWEGRDDRGQPVSSGVYFCRLTTRGFSETKKLVLLR